MKRSELRFFDSVGSNGLEAEKAPKTVNVSPQSWRDTENLPSLMEEGDFVWISGFDDQKRWTFQIGKRELYLKWLESQLNVQQSFTPVLTPENESEVFPLGLYCAKYGGRYHHAHCYANSNYEAKNKDFLVVLWAIEGFPTLDYKKLGGSDPWDVEAEDKRLGTGLYQTFSRLFEVSMPRYFSDDTERSEREDNFLEKFFD
jgi:hypothetical protein